MILTGLARRLPRLWYRCPLAFELLPLLPVSWLFRLVVAARHWMYRCGLLSAYRLEAPVVVVGNLTVGGSGKTPLVLWLVEHLRDLGYRPGVISRGYGGAETGVRSVKPESDPGDVGDEPALLARRSGVPVFVGRDRVAAGQALLAAYPECNVIVSDDGLQHLRLRRDVEIVVFDGRGPGNEQLLPAGPLREPLRRLSTVSALVWNSAHLDRPAFGQFKQDLPQFMMRLEAQRFYSLTNRDSFCSAHELRGRRLYALAGIGDPSRFFDQLTALGLVFEAYPFPDHHRYRASDLAFASDGVLLMTEKDAVKCIAVTTCEAWILPVNAHIPDAANGQSLLDIIQEKIDGCTAA